MKQTTFLRRITTLLPVLLLCVAVTGCKTKRQSAERWIIEEIQKDEMYANWDIEIYDTDKVSSGEYMVYILRQTPDNKQLIDIWVGNLEYFSGIWTLPSKNDITYIDVDYRGTRTLTNRGTD